MSIWIDLEDYTVKVPFRGNHKGRIKCRKLQTERFLKGPINMNWLVRAARLGRSALVTGLVLWHYDGMRHGRTFKIGISEAAKLFTVSRRTALRGIKRLEAANLIFVLREPGRKLIVTMNRN